MGSDTSDNKDDTNNSACDYGAIGTHDSSVSPFSTNADKDELNNDDLVLANIENEQYSRILKVIPRNIDNHQFFFENRRMLPKSYTYRHIFRWMIILPVLKFVPGNGKIHL